MLGCMTTQPLTAEPAQLSQSLHPKDRVQVVTKSGQTLKFKVQTIDAAGLHGAGQDVAFNDIESISREKIDAGRTTLLAVGIAAVAAVAASGGGGGGSGY
jgi:nanoRNase/pAp phosphatase (c-di-AMP/oligoRNAs hydrolase)